MKTIKFDIKFDNEDDEKFVLKKQNYFSYAFRKMYKHDDKLNDLSFLIKLSKRYNMSAYEINCLKIDVKTKISQYKTNKEKISSDIKSIKKEISLLTKKEKLTKKEIRTLFKLNKKLIYKNLNLSKDITFGGKNLLKQISFFNNDKINNKEIIKQKTDEYHENRILPVSYFGSLNDTNSNRYFNFDFENDIIVYKPIAIKKINISYKVSKKYKTDLLKLQKIKDLKQQSISVFMTTKFLCITFDDSKINNYDFNKKLYIDKIKDITDKDIQKQIYKEQYIELSDFKLIGKKSNRYASIDLNPEYIGVSILDKFDDNNFKLIDSFCYNLTDLIGKSGLASVHKDSKYLTNKRKYEIGVIYTDLFRKLIHYNVGYFVMEDLNFKSKNINDLPKEFNRKTKNVWNLNFQKNLINKHCNQTGIQLIEINPVYTSFIGNILYHNFDPISASIEIGRRGMIKFIKGNKLYPELTDTILDTVVERFKSFPDVQGIKDCKSWIKLYEIMKKAGIRYRWQLKDINYSCSSKFNKKCNWNIISS